jgi:cellulose biosynthesis protein BcsQ
VPNYPRLRVIRSDDETKAAERALSAPESTRTLTTALLGLIQAIGERDDLGPNNRVPLVVIDTPPGLGSLQMAALAVADYLLIPVQPSYASETGIPKMAEQIQAIRDASGRGATLLGIVPTRYKGRTIEHRTTLEQLKETFGASTIYPTVRDTVRLEEAPGQGLPVWDLDHTCGGAQDYIKVLLRLVEDMDIEVDIEKQLEESA